MSMADKLTTIAENQQRVYDKGIERGRQTQYDEFWDEVQANGTRGICRQLFSGVGWTDKTFNPKYSMRITNAVGMFNSTAITDVQAKLDECNVVFDFSACNSFVNLIADSSVTRLGVLDMRNTNALTNTFYSGSNLVTIDKLILRDSGNQIFSQPFYNCSQLKNIIIEGVVGNDIDFRYSPLSKASIESIITHLSDNTTGKTLTLKKTAKEAAFTDEEWATLTGAKTNWTISLV